MFSMPPAMMQSASPARMRAAASDTAHRPEPHTLLIVNAGFSTGIPPLTAACRAGFCPSPACSTLPRITWSTSPGLIPLRRSTSLTASAPSSTAGMSFRLPRKLPTALLQGSMT